MEIHIRVDERDVLAASVAAAAYDGVALAFITIVAHDPYDIREIELRAHRACERRIRAAVVYDDEFVVYAKPSIVATISRRLPRCVRLR